MKLTIDDIKGIGIVGCAGTMGIGWAAQLLEKGCTVIAFDESAEAMAAIRDRVMSALEWIEKRRADREKNPIYAKGFAAEAIERFVTVASLDDFIGRQSEYQVVLECIFEEMKLKQDLLTKLAESLSDEHIFWSNSSSLSVLDMGRPAGITSRLVCTHGMNPVYMMPAVECVKTKEVDEAIFDLTFKFLEEKIGKVPFTAPDVAGYWVNHLGIPFWIESIRALERGEITVQHGDTGLKFSVGHPQGTFKLMDQIGLDTMLRVTNAMYLTTNDPRYYPPVLLMQLVKAGYLGKKSGRGFYYWEGKNPTGEVDFSDYAIPGADWMPI